MENYKQINYTIKRTNRKNSIAMVFVNSHAQVRAPHKISKKIIEKFIEKNYEFILEKLQNSEFFTREYKNGEEILIHGEKYTLNTILSKINKIEIENHKVNLYVKEDTIEQKKELMENYLKSIAKIDIKRLVLKNSKLMELFPNNVKLNKAEKRWGSCNYVSKTLNFTLRNAMLNEHAQEYIVIHELAHLKHPNHSKSFWKFVEKFMPDYKEAEKYLKVNSALLQL
jgi:predicted metal-dependent hydrolase